MLQLKRNVLLHYTLVLKSSELLKGKPKLSPPEEEDKDLILDAPFEQPIGEKGELTDSYKIIGRP